MAHQLLAVRGRESTRVTHHRAGEGVTAIAVAPMLAEECLQLPRDRFSGHPTPA
ncbi:MAG: hypothetical protein HOQ09_14760 [Gemmatimonadaceae bacterium]|nr:hypothetical protein [Gemmatimonadaceae bacterium]